MNTFFILFIVVISLLWIVPTAWPNKAERQKQKASLAEAVGLYLIISLVVSGVLYGLPMLLKVLFWRGNGYQ